MKQERLHELREERLEKLRSTMTMSELSQRKNENQGPEYRTRLEFIRYVYFTLSNLSFFLNRKKLI